MDPGQLQLERPTSVKVSSSQSVSQVKFNFRTKTYDRMMLTKGSRDKTSCHTLSCDRKVQFSKLLTGKEYSHVVMEKLE